VIFVDSHCHIDGLQFDEDRDAVVKRAREAGVAAMLNVGTGDPHSGEIARAVAVAEKYDNVFAAVGVHPHDAKLYDDDAETHLIELAKSSEKVIAWGEIGLDYYYDHSPRDVQREVFRRQIRTARSLGLPVVIHSRDADEETVAILREEFHFEAETSGRSILKSDAGNFAARGDADKSVRVPGIMHCFGGTPETAKEVLDLGFFVSFAGNVTFKKAENLRDAARVVPLERLLVETDCPFLTPVPFRGKRNEPSYVVNTARFLAEFYGVEFDRLAQQTTQNFLHLFGLTLD